MVDLAMSIFEFLTKFLVFWHPWHPWVCIRSDWNHFLKQIWVIPPTVYSWTRTQPIGQQAYGASQSYAKHKDNDRLSFLPVLEMNGFSIFVVQVVQQ